MLPVSLTRASCRNCRRRHATGTEEEAPGQEVLVDAFLPLKETLASVLCRYHTPSTLTRAPIALSRSVGAGGGRGTPQAGAWDEREAARSPRTPRGRLRGRHRRQAVEWEKEGDLRLGNFLSATQSR